MKTLVLVRNGKAPHCHSGQEDIDRSLSHRGKSDSDHMAEWAGDLGLNVDAVISSPSVRAKESARYFADRWVLPTEVDERLYTAHAQDLLELIHGLNGSFETVLLVGHNPGLSECLRKLLGTDCEDLDPASVAVIKFDASEWKRIAAGSGTLETYMTPATLHYQKKAA